MPFYFHLWRREECAILRTLEREESAILFSLEVEGGRCHFISIWGGVRTVPFYLHCGGGRNVPFYISIFI